MSFIAQICGWVSIHVGNTSHTKSHLLDTVVTPIGTPSSSSTSNYTCIWSCLPHTFEYIESHPDHLKPTLDKLIDHLVATIH